MCASTGSLNMTPLNMGDTMNRQKFVVAAIVAFSLVDVRVDSRADELPAQGIALKVCGPEGPAAPMKECAGIFTKLQGQRVEVMAGPEALWTARAKNDADVIYGGAEYMLSRFISDHSCIIEDNTRTSLYNRVGGILVRKGNPKRIKSFSDLAKDGIRLLEVNGEDEIGLWEDMAGRLGLIPDIRKNIVVSVSSTNQAIEKWNTTPELDAWITFESWHYSLKDVTDLVHLPERERVYRGTPVAAATFYKNRESARLFIQFLKTEQCHAVFRKWGWE